MLSFTTIRAFSRKASERSPKKVSRDAAFLYTYVIAASTLPFVAPALKSRSGTPPNGPDLPLHHCHR